MAVLGMGNNQDAYARVQFIDLLPDDLRSDALTNAVRANTDPAFAQRRSQAVDAWSKSRYSQLVTKEGDIDVWRDLFDGEIARRDRPIVKRQVEMLAQNLMASHGFGTVEEAARAAASSIESSMGRTSMGGGERLAMYPIETSGPPLVRGMFNGRTEWIWRVITSAYDAPEFDLQATSGARHAVVRGEMPKYNVFERSEDGVMRLLSDSEPFDLGTYAEVLRPLSDRLSQIARDIEREEGVMKQHGIPSRLIGTVTLDPDVPSFAESKRAKERSNRILMRLREQARLMVDDVKLEELLPVFDTQEKRRAMRETILSSWQAFHSIPRGAAMGIEGDSP